MAAATVALFLLIDTGLMAAVRGWLRRSERLLDGYVEEPAHAMIAVVRGYERFMCGDMAGARLNSSMAIDLGSRLDVSPALVIGRVCDARVTMYEGRIDEGLDLLDEIAMDLMSGSVDPLTTGMMYCELICAAQGMALQARVIEWTEVMDRWQRGAAIGSVSGRCRVHRAEILRISGSVRRSRAGGPRGVRGVAPMDASGVRLAAGRTRQHPLAQGRSGRRGGGVPGGARSCLVTSPRVGVAAHGARRDRDGLDR